MISKIERTIAFRYLKPKKKEGFLKVISIFSFAGIALGVSVLIIVMSVMNGFRTELINKILGFNPHIIVKPYEKAINKEDIKKINFLENDLLRTAFTFSGQGIIINKASTNGILIRSYLNDEISKEAFSIAFLISGSLAFASNGNLTSTPPSNIFAILL